MKNIAIIALFIVASFIAAGPAPAQDHTVKATVPFSFTVGNQTLPAGTYAIRSQGSTRNIVAINNPAAKVTVMSLVHSSDGGPRDQHVLVFHKYRDQYFLSEIRSGASGMDVEFYPTKAEKRARIQAEEAQISNGNPVLIALN